MKLWLDDDLVYKKAPIGYLHVETAAEAIALLSSGKVEAIDLDHDLAVCEIHCHEAPSGAVTCDLGPPHLDFCPCPCHDTGYTVLCWMEENNVWPTEVRIHTNNPVGRQKMMMILDRRRFQESA